jgi:hypothetical protein
MPGGVLAQTLVDGRCKRCKRAHLEWKRVRTGFGRGGRASFVSMSSAIIFAMRMTRSSTAHSSYFRGKILTALGADRVRFGATSWLVVDWVSSTGCLLFTPGDSGFSAGFEGEEEILLGGAVGRTAIGLAGAVRVDG